MNWEKARQTAVVAICGAIVYAYLEFLAGCISNGYLPQTAFEAGMVGLQLAKLLAVLGVPRLRKAGLALTFDIFAVEMLFLPVLALLYVGLIAYVASGREPGSTFNRSSALILAIVGTLTSLAWTTGLVTFTRDTLLLFAAPTLLTVTAVWWFARAR